MRHPEVEDLHLPLDRHEHVRGLEIPVDHSLGVGVGEAPGHLGRDVNRVLNRKRPFLDLEIERLSAKKLEHQERPVLAPPHLEERDQVGMGQPRDRLGLTGDLAFLLGDATGADDLDRHLPAQVPVAGLVDHTEAPAPQFPDDLESAEDCSGWERNRLGLTLLRCRRDLLEECGQRTGLDARRSSAGIPGAFGHAHPPVRPVEAT